MSDTSQRDAVPRDAWLTKPEVSAILGVAEKTVDRMAARKEIQKNIRHRRGMSPLVVFHPEDVARIKEQRGQPLEPFIMPANSNVPAVAHPAQTALVDLLTALTGRLAAEPYDFLTLKQAREACNLPEKFLYRELVKTGVAIKISRRWYIPRANLIAFCRQLSDTSKETSSKQLAEAH